MPEAVNWRLYASAYTNSETGKTFKKKKNNGPGYDGRPKVGRVGVFQIEPDCLKHKCKMLGVTLIHTRPKIYLHYH